MFSLYQKYRSKRELNHLEAISQSSLFGEIKLTFSALLIGLALMASISATMTLVGEYSWWPPLQILFFALISANFFLDFKLLWFGKKSSSIVIGQRIQELKEELSK